MQHLTRSSNKFAIISLCPISRTFLRRSSVVTFQPFVKQNEWTAGPSRKNGHERRKVRDQSAHLTAKAHVLGDLLYLYLGQETADFRG